MLFEVSNQIFIVHCEEQAQCFHRPLFNTMGNNVKCASVTPTVGEQAGVFLHHHWLRAAASIKSPVSPLCLYQ